MKFRLQTMVVLLALATGAAAVAQQDAGAPPQQGQGSGYGQGRGGGRGMGAMGRGLSGTVTQVAADHFQVKNEAGDVYTVHFSANTRIMRTVPRPAGAANDNQPGAAGTRGGGNGGRNGWGGQGGGQMDPPVAIKATDIKVGDIIMAGGEIDDAAKSVGAISILQLDPERAKQMREMQANFGKTWLMGRVTAVNEAKVTLDSNVDHASHAFTADENTTFRKRRDPITLADVQVGDMVRVEGAVKDGAFVATNVMVMGPGPGMGTGAGQGTGSGPAGGQKPPQAPQQQ
jgi:Domain of unknown function (DUF5666)